MVDAARNYRGLLFIGDPHLEGRAPGFRKDDYPRVILDKLEWCLNYAAEQQLLPAILGDLFDKPRDNPNWMIVRLLEMLRGEVLGLYGNHDVSTNPQLTPDDSLSLLVSSGRIRLLTETEPWRGTIGGRRVVLGGSSYRLDIPRRWEEPAIADNVHPPLVIWLTHHDILIPGYDEGRIKPSELPGIHYVINGHIHRRLEVVARGGTTWLTPGNISRRARSDATRTHIPSVLRLTIEDGSPVFDHVEIPHSAFDEVFHAAIADAPDPAVGRSAFVAGLAELQSRRTDSGAGLMEFLNRNSSQFAPAVAAEIFTLAQETEHE